MTMYRNKNDLILTSFPDKLSDFNSKIRYLYVEFSHKKFELSQ